MLLENDDRLVYVEKKEINKIKYHYFEKNIFVTMDSQL